MIRSFWTILCAAALLPSAFADNSTSIDRDRDVKAAQAMLANGDYAQAFAIYHAAATNGHHPLAQFSLAQFYQNGWGGVVDQKLACSWFEQAAQSGVPAAQHMTGLCYEAGTHRPADPAVAAGWFQKAAQAGHLHSICHLGNLLMTGNGAAKDPNKALELCRSAALQGSVPAQIWMGKFHLYGDPTVRNPQDAYQWFLAAAQKHTAEAFYHLGTILDQGLIDSHDAVQPRQLFEQAASLKYIPAYFQAGKHFFAAEPDSETNRLSAEHLAKAYLWISAAIHQSTDAEEVAAAQTIRQKILAVMPLTWLAELDRKVTQHVRPD
ncbi:MAG: tetratricopeptide repeat protein [Sedimentisphaerales bacterium]|nr:tetratricopeptide repeat protein [Sedimentisphaerales bacterium]